MQNLEIVEAKGMRVLTTKQIAEAYGTTKDKIIYNFNYNKNRYILGKHYIEVSGQELKDLKRTCENQISFKYAKTLYLWTEKGALLHAKSLNTDKAWEVYDWLVDFYFRVKEEQTQLKFKPVKNSNIRTVVDVPENAEILSAIKKVRDDLTCMEVLLSNCIKYIEEETYLERRKAAADMVNLIIADVTTLMLQKPKLLQKYI